MHDNKRASAPNRGLAMMTACVTMSRRALLAAIGTLALTAAAPAHAGVEREASRFIEQLAADTVAIVGDEAATSGDRSGRLRGLLDRGFDTEVIGRFVLGRYWNGASETQQRDFVALFRDFTVASYARRFDSYAGQTLQVLEARDQGGEAGKTKVLVSSRMLRPGADAVRIDWRVRQTGDGWRIYDVVVEGISMVLTQRSEFAAVLQRSGGNIDGLLEQLRASTARLEGAGRPS
jgi:phospholipid transport system substrate-binding protein